MIVWTVNEYPVNMHTLSMDLIVRPRCQKLMEDIATVMAESFKIDREFDDTIPEGICKNCGEDEVSHSPSLCEGCVEAGLVQCECCQIQYDLTYLFDKHNVNLKFSENA